MLSPVGTVSKGRVRLRILRWGRPGYSDAITGSFLKTSGPRDSGPVNTPEMRSSFVPPAIWTMVAATPWLWGHTALLPSPPHTNPTSWELWAPLGRSRLHLPLIWTWGGPLRTWERSVKWWAWGKARRLECLHREVCKATPVLRNEKWIITNKNGFWFEIQECKTLSAWNTRWEECIEVQGTVGSTVGTMWMVGGSPGCCQGPGDLEIFSP